MSNPEPPPRLRNAVAALEELVNELARHKHHPWSKVDHCVWCDTCHVRLYQGSPLTAAEKAYLPEVSS